VNPPAPAKSVVVAVAEPVTPYRTGAFDPEPRVEPLPPFKDEPKPMTQAGSEGGGSGLVASSAGGVSVSTITTPAYGSARTASAVPQQPPLPASVARAAMPTLPSIAPASSSGATGSRASASASGTPPSSKTVKTPASPATEPPVADGKGHTSWPAPPPLASAPPPVNDPWPHPPAVDERPHQGEVKLPPPPAKGRPAKSEEFYAEFPDRGGKIVMLATADARRDHDFGFGMGYGRGPGHIRREFIDEKFIRTITGRGHKHTTASATAAAVPRYEAAEIAADMPADIAASPVDCPPVSGDKSLDLAAVTSGERDDFARPFARAFEEQRVIAYEASAAPAADYAFAAGSPALFAQAVPEPSGVVAVAFAGLCGFLSRRTRRR
jgi:hypothetical protein